MLDKRDECGCHRECTTIPHTCDRPCSWPDCLSPEEQMQLSDEVLQNLQGTEMTSRDRDWPPFTCGTEFEIWQANWCGRCVHEHSEYGGHCEDFDPAFTEDRVPDILVESDGLWVWECTKFSRRPAG